MTWDFRSRRAGGGGGQNDDRNEEDGDTQSDGIALRLDFNDLSCPRQNEQPAKRETAMTGQR
jgi:hypothetical protein